MIDYYVLILFNTKKPHLGNNTDPKWLDYRLDIFRRYTLKSLHSQTSGPFRIWMACSKESKDMLIPRILAARMIDPNMDSVVFIFDEEAACSSLENNERSLYFLKIDSDDLYRPDTIERTRTLLGNSADISMIMFCNGFILDLKTGSLCEFTRWSIGTYAVHFPPRTFDLDNYREYLVCDQTKVRSRFNPRLDLSKAVCCLDHDMNLHKDPRREGVERAKRTGQSKPICHRGAENILKDYGIRE